MTFVLPHPNCTHRLRGSFSLRWWLTLQLARVYLDTSPPRGATSLHKTYFSLHSFHQWVQTQQPVLPVWPGHDSPISWRNLTKHLTAKATWQFFLETHWMLPVPEQTHYREPYLMLHVVPLYNRNAVFFTWFVVHFFSYFNVKLQRSLSFSHTHPHTHISAACKICSNTKISACCTNASRTSLSCGKR